MLFKRIFKKRSLFSFLLSLPMLGLTGSLLAKEPSPKTTLECSQQYNVQKLSDLMGQRLHLMEELAAYRWNHKAPLDPTDSPSVQQIIQQYAGASPEAMENLQKFFNAQVDASQLMMMHHFEEWIRSGVHKHEYTPDLQTLIAKLQSIDSQLLKAFSQIQCLNQKDKESFKIAVGQILQAQGFSREVVDAALHF